MATREQRIAKLRRTIAANIRRIRDERGLTQEAAANRSGISWRHYQKAEAGKLNMTLETLSKIALGLGVDVTELFTPVEH